MDNVSEKLSETQTEISENITPLSGEELIDANSQKLSENEHSKISLESDEIRRRKSNRSERSESYRKDRKILEVVEEKPAFHEYTGLSEPEKPKSLWVAYLFWLIGGIFGLHHFYLRRDRQAFICWSTLGGYVIGWLCEIFTIPEMVRDANEDPRFIDNFKEQLRLNRKPPFAVGKFASAVMAAYLWSQVFMIAIPESEHFGISWKFLHWLVPFVVALGVWTVGNCGREQGPLRHCLIAAYLAYPIRYILYDEVWWLTATVVVSALAFDHWSKAWLLRPPKRRSMKRRVATLYFCGCLYLALFGSYFIFNGKMTDSEGDEVPVYEALQNAFKSAWWLDLKQSLGESWTYARHHGFYATWKQILEQLDTDGEQNAYKVLGLLPTASQSEITATFRKLSKENHPDKIKGEHEKQLAQERFMEISMAYEKLSSSKSKRRQKNKKSQEATGSASSSTIEL